MGFRTYNDGSGSVYDPVREFEAIPASAARETLDGLRDSMERFEGIHAERMAEAIDDLKDDLPTENGRLPVDVLDEWATSSDQARREAAKQLRAEFLGGV